MQAEREKEQSSSPNKPHFGDVSKVNEFSLVNALQPVQHLEITRPESLKFNSFKAERNLLSSMVPKFPMAQPSN